MSLSEKVIEVLNRAFQADPCALHSLAAYRVPCSKALADDPHVTVDAVPTIPGGYFAVGMVGIVNGILLAAGEPVIGSNWSDETDDEGRKKMLGFAIAFPPQPAELSGNVTSGNVVKAFAAAKAASE